MNVVLAEVKPEAKPEVPAKLDKRQKLEVYKKLLNVTDLSKTSVPELAQRIGVPVASLAGMLTQMKVNPKIRGDLALAGYTNSQIPAWVAATATPATQADAASHPDADAGPLATPAPAGNPAPIVVRASENTAAPASPAQPSPGQPWAG